MKRANIRLVLTSVLLLGSTVAALSEEPKPSPRAIRKAMAYWASAEVAVPQANAERLSIYERVFNEEVTPRFVAELRKENPTIRKEDIHLYASAVPDKGAITLMLTAQDEKTGVAWATRAAEMAVSAIVGYDEAERRRMIEPVRRQVDELEGVVRNLAQELLAVRAKAGVYSSAKELDLLLGSLHSYKEQLVQAEMRNAELETKLSVLSKRAAQVKNSISSEELAALERTAHDLAVELDEMSGTSYQQALAKGAIILKQKEDEFQRIRALFERSLTTNKEVKDAEDALNLAKGDYEALRAKPAELKQRVERVRKDLDKAKEQFASEGGLGASTAIAEKTLECETDLAANKTKMEHLRAKIASLEREIPEKRVLALDVDRLQARIDAYEAAHQAARQEQAAVERTTPVRQPEIVGVTWWARPVDVSELELRGWADVQGEVKTVGMTGVSGPKATVLQAIEVRGGFTDNADMEHVTVFRKTDGSTEKHVIDCKAILEGKAPDDFIIEAKDLVWVPSKTGKGEVVQELPKLEPEETIAVEVKGEVKKPGQKQLKKGSATLRAIEAAGEFTDEADLRRISLMRAADGSAIQHIFSYDLIRKGALSGQLGLRAGDTITVPRKADAKPLEAKEQAGRYDVLGEVRDPGSHVFHGTTTILVAIAAAGGFTDYADKGRVVVIRKTNDLTQRYYIDCVGILKGDLPDDFIILAGDMIWVGQRGIL